MSKRILHVMIAEKKFTIPLATWMSDQNCFDNHYFLFFSNGFDNHLHIRNAEIIKTPFKSAIIFNIFLYYTLLLKADKIVLHGLPFLNLILFVPWKWKRTSWVIHGSDLYERLKIKEFFIHNLFFKSLSSHITHIEGDSILANNHFKSKVKIHYSPMYLSNVYNQINAKAFKNKSSNFNVLVGNSLSKNNNHIAILEQLSKYTNDIVKVFCPLSYGNDIEYRDLVIKNGSAIFGDKFVPIMNFMPLNEYNAFLESIDIAVFDHWRQEAMGITLTLLSLGKTVYMRKNTESYASLKKRGFLVYNNQLVFQDGLKFFDTSINRELVSNYYSSKVLENSLLNI